MKALFKGRSSNADNVDIKMVISVRMPNTPEMLEILNTECCAHGVTFDADKPISRHHQATAILSRASALLNEMSDVLHSGADDAMARALEDNENIVREAEVIDSTVAGLQRSEPEPVRAAA